MSKTHTVLPVFDSGMPLSAPRNVRRASSSPEIVRASTPNLSFTCARTASPPPASRIALVPTTATRSAPSLPTISAYASRHPFVRAIASGASTLVRSTPCPSRVIVACSSTATSPPSAPGSATNNSTVFVPTSIVATRIALSTTLNANGSRPGEPFAKPRGFSRGPVTSAT
jgi:hypothetical protein